MLNYFYFILLLFHMITMRGIIGQHESNLFVYILKTLVSTVKIKVQKANIAPLTHQLYHSWQILSYIKTSE